MQGKQLTCQSSECSKASCCPLKTQIPEIPNLPASPHKQHEANACLEEWNNLHISLCSGPGPRGLYYFQKWSFL